MKPLLAILLAGLAGGCYSYQPRVTRYPNIPPNLTLIEVDQATINAICRLDINGKKAKNHMTDDGRLIMNGTNFRGCYQPWSNTIYIERFHLDCLRHELGHASGLDKEVVAAAIPCD